MELEAEVVDRLHLLLGSLEKRTHPRKPYKVKNIVSIHHVVILLAYHITGMDIQFNILIVTSII